MVIEIFGLTFKPEISISDLAAIAALISSAVVFWSGLNQTRKSEQTKIAREVTDRIDMKTENVKRTKFSVAEAELALKDPKEWGVEEARQKVKETSVEVSRAVDELLVELEYFDYLVMSHQIRNYILLYYTISRSIWGLREADDRIEILRILKADTYDILNSRMKSLKSRISYFEKALDKYKYRNIDLRHEDINL
ncbi:MAG TPA: hypothetical protein VH500_11125 [Nitrososphaeraceae archaeon]